MLHLRGFLIFVGMVSFVPCVLHRLMAIGCLLCALILSNFPEKHQEVKEDLRIGKMGYNMAAARFPAEEETKCLLEVWPLIASTLRNEGSMANTAVVQMSNLIRQVYALWQFKGQNLAAEYDTVAVLFATNVAPHGKATFLFMLQHNCPVNLKGIYPCWLVMLCQDVCESCNGIFKGFTTIIPTEMAVVLSQLRGRVVH